MYDRITDRARTVFQLANKIAEQQGDEYIGSVHILLGILQEGRGVAAKLIEKLFGGTDRVRAAAEECLKENWAPTPPLKPLIDLAIEEAKRLNHDFVATEHILLALLRLPDSTVARLFEQFGAKPEMIREELYVFLGRRP